MSNNPESCPPALLLTREQSEVIAGHARPGQCFVAVLHRGSWPDSAGRWKLSLIPASTQAVNRFVKRQEAQEGG